MAQIIKDLDDAIAKLPATWSAEMTTGRIDKCAAMAFKGKVLLMVCKPVVQPGQRPSPLANRLYGQQGGRPIS